jgi:hypothetical protein
MVRRCNGTTAGQGYLEVIWIVLRTFMLYDMDSLNDNSA